jgi:hypothetical protein
LAATPAPAPSAPPAAKPKHPWWDPLHLDRAPPPPAS